MKTCSRGHPYTPENRYHAKKGTQCRACMREREQRKRDEAKAARAVVRPPRELPPPAEQPEAPHQLARTELAKERRASARRRDAKFAAILAAIQPRPNVRIGECVDCFKEFAYRGRRVGCCPSCREARATRPRPTLEPSAEPGPKPTRTITARQTITPEQRRANELASEARYREQNRERLRAEARAAYAKLSPEEKRRRTERAKERYHERRRAESSADERAA